MSETGKAATGPSVCLGFEPSSLPAFFEIGTRPPPYEGGSYQPRIIEYRTFFLYGLRVESFPFELVVLAGLLG